MTDRDQPSMSAFPTFRATPRWMMRSVVWLWRKAWRYAAAVLGLLIIAHLALNLVAGRRLEAELARVRAEGAPLTLAQAAPPKVPDSQNAAVLYQQAYKQAFAGSEWRKNLEEEVVAAFLPSEVGRTPHRPRPTVAQVEAILARHEADFRLLEQGSLRPACRFPVNWENPNPMEILFPHLAGVRQATRFLAAKALVDAHHGRAAEALNDLAIAIRISNHMSAEPTLIAQLVRVARIGIVSEALPGVLAAAPPTAAESRPFYDLLGKVDMTRPWVHAMEGERCCHMAFFDQLRRAKSGDTAMAMCGDLPGSSQSVFDQFRRWAWRLALTRMWPLTRVVWAPFLKLDEVYYLRHMRRVIALHKQPYRISYADYERLGKNIEESTPWYALLSRIMSPVFIRALATRDKAIACIGLMQAALALRAYQVEHGSYPASLADLRAAGGWAIPDDPFSGKPFIYRRERAGYLIYSVAEDMKDDGGVDRETAFKLRRNLAPRHRVGLAAWQVPYDLPLRMTR
jgi:hypothetical protein